MRRFFDIIALIKEKYMTHKKILIPIIVVLVLIIGFLLLRESQRRADLKADPDLAEYMKTGVYPEDSQQKNGTTEQETSADVETFEKTLAMRGENWTLWRVTVDKKNIDMDVNVSGPLTLQFDTSKKSYSGFAGCNNFSGTYQSSGELAFDFGSTVSTKKACDAMELETAIFQAMDKAHRFFIKGDQLVFTSEDGYTELVYSKAI